MASEVSTKINGSAAAFARIIFAVGNIVNACEWRFVGIINDALLDCYSCEKQIAIPPSSLAPRRMILTYWLVTFLPKP